MGGESGGVHTRGWQRDVVRRRMEKGIEWEAGQDLQVGLDPGEGLEAGGKSGSTTNMADVRANMAAVTKAYAAGEVRRGLFSQRARCTG